MAIYNDYGNNRDITEQALREQAQAQANAEAKRQTGSIFGDKKPKAK